MTAPSGWLNSLLSEMQQNNAKLNVAAQYNPASRMQNAVATRPTLGDVLAAPSTFTQPLPLDDVSGGPSIMDRVIDVLQRPLYGAGNLATNLVKEAQGKETDKSDLSAVVAGVTGKSKETYMDAFKEAGVNPTLATILGTAANIFGDPANLVYGPLGGAAVKGLKGLTGSTRAAKAAEKFKDIAEANKPDFEGLSTATTQATAAATSPLVDQLVGTPRAIAPAPRFEAGPGGIESLAQNNVSKDLIDSTIKGVNKKVYNIGSVSSPYVVYSDELNSAISAARRNPAEQRAFVQRYKSILDSKDLAALQRTRSPQAFDEVADNILKRTQPAGVNSVQEFVNAARHGEIPTDDVNKVLDTAYATDLDHLVAKYHASGGDSTQPFVQREMPSAEAPVVNPTPEPGVTVPKPETVKNVAASIPEDPLARLQYAQDVGKVLKQKVTAVPVDKQAGGFNAAAMRHYKDSQRATGIMGRGEQRLMAARKVYEDRGIVDKEFHERGGHYDTRAVDPKPGSDKAPVYDVNGKLVNIHSWDLGSSDVMSVLGVPGIGQSVIGYGSRLDPGQLLRMGAAALDARRAGLAPHEINAFVEHVGQMQDRPQTHYSYSGARTGKGIDKTIKQTAENITKGVDRLAERVANNVQVSHDAVAKAAGSVVNDVETRVLRDISEETGTRAAAVDSVSDIGRMTSKAADGHEDVTAAAGATIAEDLASVVNAGDVRAARTVKDNAAGYRNKPEVKAQKDATNNAVTQAKGDAKDAQQELLSVMPDHLDPWEKEDITASAEFNQIAEKKYNPITNLLGVFGRKGRDIAQDAVNGRAGAVTAMKEFDNDLYAKTKMFDADTLRTAFNSLQLGQWPAKDTEAYAAAQVLKNAVDKAGFDTSHMDKLTGVDSLAGSIFGREYTTADIHRAMDEAGIPKSQVLPLQEKLDEVREKSGYKISDRELLSQAWRHVEIDNPIDFVARLNGAARNLAVEATVGTHFAERYGSLVRKEGYVRLKDDISIPGGSRFWQYVPKVDKQGRPIYYPKEAAEWMAHTENVVAAANGMTKASGPIAKFMKDYYDPLLAIWKTTVTVARPGFLVRNFNGDTMLNFLAGVNGVKPYKDALQVMKAGGRLKKRTIDTIGELLSDPSDVTAVGHWTGTVHLKNGKKTVLNDKAMYALAYQNGVPVSFRLSQDVMAASTTARGGGSGLQKVADRLLSTRYVQTMSRMTEESSHIPRMAQFVHHMQDPAFTSRFRTLDEAAQAATTNVRKYHPDVTGLSPAGQKYMRRAYPFYSWSRLVIPTVLESLLTKPTSITALPKAIYGANQLMGGGAASPSELFPPTRLLPSFVRDTLGYAGGDFTFNLGSPVESLADTFNGNPARNIFMGMANPLAKGAIDLTTGTNQSTGGPIPDKSDYYDQMIPVINQLSNITGVSMTGTIAKIVTGQGIVDPQRPVQQGEKKVFLNQSLFNFLTGLGYNNFNRDSYQNIAQSQYRGGG